MAHPQQQEGIAEQLARLDKLLSPEYREKIKAALVKKIGKPPTKAQRAALDRQREQILGTL